MARRAALLALLVYVTLDLSLPAMPGAFVFDPTDSVESAHAGRGRNSAEVMPLAPPAPDVLGVSAVDTDMRHRPMLAGGVRSSAPRLGHPLPRAALAHAPGRLTSRSEDPH